MTQPEWSSLLESAANTATHSYSPYVVAVIAVAGTAFGAVLAAGTQMLTTRIARRAQREDLDAGFEHEAEMRLLDERRAVFTSMLRCIRQAQNVTLQCNLHYKRKNAVSSPTEPAVDLPPERTITNTNSDLLGTLAMLSLVSDQATYDIAFALVHDMIDELWDRWSGNSAVHHPTRGATHYALLAQMQLVLGVKDGLAVDPLTGHRIKP